MRSGRMRRVDEAVEERDEFVRRGVAAYELVQPGAKILGSLRLRGKGPDRRLKV